MERTNEIKVYFPAVGDGFSESMWVLVDDDVYELYWNDAEGMVCSGTLDNDSYCNSSLVHGTEVQFRMCGKMTPEAIY